MRLLFAIVHYYKSGDGRHGSLAADPKPRIDALRRLILQLHRLYGQPAGLLNHLQRRVDGVEDGGGPVSLRVCVSDEYHVLDMLSDCESLYRKETCNPQDPRLLGFETQRVLLEAFTAAEADGEPFDYIAFLEDDILLTDPDFFLKLRCFNQAFGNHYLLMPNRIETMEHQGQLRRFYIDGDYNPAASASYRQSTGQQLCFPHLGEMVTFEQPSNLHSGCFFLNRDQARIWATSGHAAAVDTSFHGPLESAATLGMLKTFQLMKPSPKNGRFLTVEHGGRNFMGLVPMLSHD
tara:strand:+ start:1015 stop:1890 length:876 start_codon:yes stop_codon:yes gene_type:complete